MEVRLDEFVDDTPEIIIDSIHISADIIKKLPGDAGAIECPLCKKRLEWSRNTKQQIQGKCETTNCIDWWG